MKNKEAVKNPRVLTCSCGKNVKVSKYISGDKYTCAKCRGKNNG